MHFTGLQSLITHLNNRNELLGFFHGDVDVVAVGFDHHVDVGEFFTFIDGSNVKRADVDAEFAQSGCNAGEHTDVVLDSKCGLE